MSRRFKDIQGRRTFAVTMLIISILSSLGLDALAAWQHALAADVAAFNANPTGPISDPVMAWAAVLVLVTLVYLILYIVTIVAFLMWMHRASANCVALGSEMRISPGWAVGWWFIPFANMVMPASAMLEIARESEPPDEERESMGLPEPTRAPLIVTWWVSWLLMNIVTTVGTRIADSTDPDEVRLGATVAVIGYALAPLAGTLAILVVAGITSRQMRLVRALLRRPPEAEEDDGAGYTEAHWT